ncbi:hypothetical protein [Nocardia sp. NPDC046763]|uniref:hypothetical protein n=1 Tax=Nocardia sp. NPDC046763 TaxID=3155256 RepID=UPI0033E172E5
MFHRIGFGGCAQPLFVITQQGLEMPGIHRFGREFHRVSGGFRDQESGGCAARAIGFRHAAQIVDVHLRTDRRIAFPQIVDEPIGAGSAAVRGDRAGLHGQQLFHRGAAAKGGNR